MALGDWLRLPKVSLNLQNVTLDLPKVIPALRHAKTSIEGKTKKIPKRYVLACMGFLCVLTTHSLEAILSVAIVGMVKQTDDDCGPKSTNKSIDNTIEINGDFIWSRGTQGIIQSMYYYGMMLAPSLAGLLMKRLGGKKVVAIGFALTGIFNLISPPHATTGGAVAFGVIRILIGLSCAAIIPSVLCIYNEWFPQDEKSTVFSALVPAVNLGTTCGMSLSGCLVSAGGWPLPFYVFGVISIIFIIPWWFLVYEKPSDHPTISEEEKNKIEEAMANQNNDIETRQKNGTEGSQNNDTETSQNNDTENNQNNDTETSQNNDTENNQNNDTETSQNNDTENNQNYDTKAKAPSTPWLPILTSSAVWAVAVLHFAYSWVMFTFITGLPFYLSRVLKYNIKQSAFLTSLPYMLQFFSSIGFSILSRWIREKKYLSHRMTYWTMNGLCFIGSAVSMFIVTQVDRDYATIIAMFSTYGVLAGAFYGGSYLNHVDLSPNHSKALMGINQSFIGLSGVVVPVVMGELTSGEQTTTKWNSVFEVSIGISVLSYCIYLVFGRVDEQPWNNLNTNFTFSSTEKTKVERFVMRLWKGCQWLYEKKDSCCRV